MIVNKTKQLIVLVCVVVAPFMSVCALLPQKTLEMTAAAVVVAREGTAARCQASNTASSETKTPVSVPSSAWHRLVKEASTLSAVPQATSLPLGACHAF